MKGKLKNPMLIASAIAIACMFFDDLPGPHYGTGRDPGTAAMLSIIFANAITVMIWRGRWLLAVLAFLPALLLKPYGQVLFWAPSAPLRAILIFFTAHALLAFIAVRKAPLSTRFGAAFIACCAVIAGILVSYIALVGFQSFNWSHTVSGWIIEYFLFGTARVILPSSFWLGVLLAEKDPTSPSTPRELLSSSKLP